jgi:hypothetical protein
MLIPKKKDNIEISVRKKQKKEKFLFSGVLKPKPNQRVFKLDLITFELAEAEYVLKTDTINYLDVINGTWNPPREIIIEDNCDYVIKLNIKNALDHFNKKYNTNCKIIGTHQKINKHNNINVYKYNGE